MSNTKAVDVLKKDDLIVIGGAGGFIAGSLARYFADQGFTNIRVADKKPLYEWYQVVPGVESLCLDLSIEENCKRLCEGAKEVYNLAADMGGMNTQLVRASRVGFHLQPGQVLTGLLDDPVV